VYPGGAQCVRRDDARYENDSCVACVADGDCPDSVCLLNGACADAAVHAVATAARRRRIVISLCRSDRARARWNKRSRTREARGRLSSSSTTCPSRPRQLAPRANWLSVTQTRGR